MNKLELIEIEENYFSFSGTVECYDNFKKTEKHTDELFELNKFWLQNIEIEIECLSLNYKIKDYFGFSRPLSIMYSDNISENISENNIVALYQILFYSKKFDKRIIDIFCGKKYGEFVPIFYGEIPTIPIEIYEYGYNNRITMFVDIATFLNILKEGKLKYKKQWAIDFFKKKYNIDIENIDSDDLVQFLLDIKKYEEIFDDIDRKKRDIEWEEYRIAKEYFENKYPFKKDDYIFDRDSIFKIRELNIHNANGYYEEKRKHPVESRFMYIINAVEMIGSGESKRNNLVFISKKSKIICSVSDYDLLSKKYNLSAKPNKYSLMKIFNKKNNEIKIN